MQVRTYLLCQWANVAGNVVGADVGYSIPIVSIAAAAAPAAATTYYFGADGQSSVQTVYTMASLMVLRAGTIRGCFVKARIGTPGTAELATHSVRVNDATDVLVATGAYNSTSLDINNSAMNQVVAVGDTLVFKLATPAVWATPPLSVRWEGYVLIV
jgi:hypothetical protein